MKTGIKKLLSITVCVVLLMGFASATVYADYADYPDYDEHWIRVADQVIAYGPETVLYLRVLDDAQIVTGTASEFNICIDTTNSDLIVTIKNLTLQNHDIKSDCSGLYFNCKTELHILGENHIDFVCHPQQKGNHLESPDILGVSSRAPLSINGPGSLHIVLKCADLDPHNSSGLCAGVITGCSDYGSAGYGSSEIADLLIKDVNLEIKLENDDTTCIEGKNVTIEHSNININSIDDIDDGKTATGGMNGLIAVGNLNMVDSKMVIKVDPYDRYSAPKPIAVQDNFTISGSELYVSTSRGIKSYPAGQALITVGNARTGGNKTFEITNSKIVATNSKDDKKVAMSEAIDAFEIFGDIIINSGWLVLDCDRELVIFAQESATEYRSTSDATFVVDETPYWWRQNNDDDFISSKDKKYKYDRGIPVSEISDVNRYLEITTVNPKKNYMPLNQNEFGKEIDFTSDSKKESGGLEPRLIIITVSLAVVAMIVVVIVLVLNRKKRSAVPYSGADFVNPDGVRQPASDTENDANRK